MGKKSKNQTLTEEQKTEDVKPISLSNIDEVLAQVQVQKRGKKEIQESIDDENEEQTVIV